MKKFSKIISALLLTMQATLTIPINVSANEQITMPQTEQIQSSSSKTPENTENSTTKSSESSTSSSSKTTTSSESTNSSSTKQSRGSSQSTQTEASVTQFVQPSTEAVSQIPVWTPDKQPNLTVVDGGSKSNRVVFIKSLKGNASAFPFFFLFK